MENKGEVSADKMFGQCREEIERRRQMVAELLRFKFNPRQIADTLKTTIQTINADIGYVNEWQAEQVKKNVEILTQEHLGNYGFMSRIIYTQIIHEMNNPSPDSKLIATLIRELRMIESDSTKIDGTYIGQSVDVNVNANVLMTPELIERASKLQEQITVRPALLKAFSGNSLLAEEINRVRSNGDDGGNGHNGGNGGNPERN